VRKRGLGFLFSMLLLGLLLPLGARAALSAVGPIDPSHGFPSWYQDGNGLTLEICLDPLDPLCLPMDDVDPDQPVSFPSNFPHEAFWWAADSSVSFPAGGSVSLVLAMEAAFANDVPQAGDRISFARVRIRGQGLPLGKYRITHPYGQQTFDVTTLDGRQINFTDDVGIEPEVFTGALNGAIGPFLVWDPAVAPAAPAGYVGDPNTPHRVVGSPLNTNFFRVERIDVSPNVVVTNFDFGVSGKIFTGTGPLPTVPTTSAPVASIIAPQTLSTTGRGLVSVSWTGSDPQNDIVRFELQRSFNGGAFTAVALPSSLSTSVNVALDPGAHQFRVRAIDAAGNVGAFKTGETFGLRLLSQSSTAVRYVGTWTTYSVTGALGGSVRASDQAGATATLVFTGTGVSWVATPGTNRGIADVLIDGVLVGSVDLYSPTRQTRRVVFSRSGLTNGTHTLTVRVRGARNPRSTLNRVDVDGFLVQSVLSPAQLAEFEPVEE
jgi:hypothetical protein